MVQQKWLIGAILSMSLKSSVSGDCFPNAVPAEQRSLLLSESETFPLGIQTVGNAHGKAVSAAFKILTEEVLGIQAIVSEASLATVGDRFWSLAGCSFTDSAWDCSSSISKVHVQLAEIMEIFKEQELSKVQQLRVGGIIDRVGGTGFSLIEGLHLSGAWTANSTSAALEYFRSYNVFERPLTHRYFSSFNEVNASGLVLPCDAWTLFDSVGIDNYINLTGDVDGLTLSSDGALTLRCHDPNWWLAPGCRSNPEDCIPCVTCAAWGIAWYIKEITHKAVIWKMPLAVGAGSSCGRDGTFFQIPTKYNVLFYYWGPDAMFNDLNPVQLIFPPTNRKEWASNNMATLRQANDLQTMMHRDVNRWAPQIRTFLTQMKWNQADVNSLLGYVGESDWNGTLAAACQWLKDNDVWKEWIPESTKCLAGQGLYSSINGIYVLHRHEATDCRSCPSGQFSRVLSDDLGETAICSPCSPGYWQSSYGSLVCDPCFPGTFMKDSGATECEKCLQGEYQDLQAQTECSLCRDEETTKVLGATSHADCECKVGYFWQENASLCVPCMEGVTCLGGRSAPLQQYGFWVQAEDRDGLLDFSVLRCRPANSCPAGDLGVCAQHREGSACASCALGYRSTSLGGRCESCGGGTIVLAIFVALVVILVGAFPLAETRSEYFNERTKITSSLLVVAAMVGQGIVAMQSLEAISSLDFSWLEPLKSWFRLLSALLLDVEILGFSCYVASDQVVLLYAAKLLAFPAFGLLTWLVFLLTNALAKILRQGGGLLPVRSLFSIHALLLVSFYTAISLIVFVPFQCSINPTGIFTLRAHAQVVCGDADHGAMLLFAVLGVLFYPVAIWVALLVITWKYPVWLCSGKGIETLRKFRVIFGRFKPERYYYCLLLTTMNLAVACIPAIFVSSASFQLGSMALVLWTKQVLLCFLWPWREEAANWTDLLLVGGVMMVLNLAGPLLRADDGNSINTLAILLSSAFLCLPASLLIGMSAAVIYRLRPSSVYSAFLCHHKASSGALCRYFKLMMKRVDSRAKVFYDADNLLNLSQLFDIVGRDVKCLVVFMSEGLFQSPWCTGEICSAFSAKVHMVNIACDGYTPPDYDEVNMILSSWTEDRKNALLTHGFDMDAVRTACAFLHRVETFELSRIDSLDRQEAVARQVIDTIFKQIGRPRQSLRVDSFLPSEAGVVQLLVCGASARTHGEKQPEAVSTCFILQQQLQARLRVPTLLVESKEDVLSASCANWMVVLLTHGLLRDSRFGQILVAKPNLNRLVLNDGTFDFPRTTHLARLEQCDESLGIEEISNISAAFQSLCTYIALPWTPQGSEALMEQQLQEISLRLGDVEVNSCSPSLFLSSARLSPKNTSYDFDEGEHLQEIDEEVQMAF